MKKIIFNLGASLVGEDVLTQEQLQTFLAEAKEHGKALPDLLVERKLISERQLLKVYEQMMQVKSVVLSDIDISKEVVNLISEKLARRYNVIPFVLDEDVLHLAMVDPLDIIAIKDIRRETGLSIKTYVCLPRMVEQAIEYYFTSTSTDKMYEELSGEYDFDKIDQIDESMLNQINNAPIVKLVNRILSQAVKLGVSDVHIEPDEEIIRIRYRIDGALSEFLTPNIAFHNAIVTRIKIMANLNIAEQRVPQDGRVETEIAGNKIDLRISILPTIYGEKIVIRILNRSKNTMTKNELGFSENNLKRFNKMVSSPHGIVLVTGPTGSGKTTTLYAALTEVNDVTKNIITVEDPVEYRMKGVNQTQVNVKAGLTFAEGLRSILRQDPDIIMIGEIRDSETANIAVRAAITGHLVFSTVHTNDTSSTIPRLVDMGIEPYLLSSSLVGIHAQRLIKKICPKCKTSYPIDEIEAEIMGLPPGYLLHKGTGCKHCNNTGYKGRIAIHEILTVNKRIKILINKGATADEIREVALTDGMETLRDSAITNVMNGISTVEEVVRLTNAEED